MDKSSKIIYLQSDNNGSGEFEFFGCSNNTFGNDITSHDSTKNVNHDCVNLEGGLNFLH